MPDVHEVVARLVGLLVERAVEGLEQRGGDLHEPAADRSLPGWEPLGRTLTGTSGEDFLCCVIGVRASRFGTCVRWLS